MDCFKICLITSRTKPLPAIPHSQNSIIDLYLNQPSESQFQTIEHTISMKSTIFNGVDSDKPLQFATSLEAQNDQHENIHSIKKMGFLWPWPKRSKLVYSNPKSSFINCRKGLNSKNKTPFCKINQQNAKIVITLYPYERQNCIELSFKKNEKLVIVDDKQSDWWLAYKMNFPKNRGFIPMNFVKIFNIDDEEWFFSKISRHSAEWLLLKPDNLRGTFLIRNNETDLGALLSGYSLSIRDSDNHKLDHVKHYKIQIDQNCNFFIIPPQSFVELQDLIEHYSTSEYGLCHRLTMPCPKMGKYSFVRDDEIDRRELKFVRELGSGNFGKVFFGIYQGKTKVAVKILKPGSMSPSAFLQEAAIMRRYRHSKLLQLYGVCSARLPLLIVTEFMSKGSLLNYLKNNPESANLTIIDLIEMASQIAAGMAYLEQVKLVHRDLAARNCLVGDNRVVKVADFGLARVIEDDYYNAPVSTKFPIKWTAPEAAKFGKFSSKSDVWSYGILLYELVTRGQVPYPKMTNRDVLKRIECGYRMPMPTNVQCPYLLYQIMLQCWDKEAQKRPTFQYLYGHFNEFFVVSDSDIFEE